MPHAELDGIQNLKLLQGIKNIADFLVENREPASSWPRAANLTSWKSTNASLSALFVNNDLRQADAHEVVGRCIRELERLGFDSAQLSNGYGTAFDFVFDKVINSLQGINSHLRELLRS